jgi:hypothetical protein
MLSVRREAFWKHSAGWLAFQMSICPELCRRKGRHLLPGGYFDWNDFDMQGEEAMLRPFNGVKSLLNLLFVVVYGR